jgi:transglutaminase-like putative cysteine protease
VTIDGKLYHVSKNGYAIDRYAKGLHEIDGGMYYVKENGSVLTNSAVEYLTFNANGRYTSGNATLDSYVDQALAACTNSGMTKAQKLRAAYLYVRDHGAYLARPHQARGTTAWAEESALFMFEHKKGNCYCFAGQFLYMARRLGYNAYVVSGGVGRKDSDHAWVMICENGVPYIYDAELEWGYRAGRYGHAEYNMYKMPLNKTVFSYQFP